MKKIALALLLWWAANPLFAADSFSLDPSHTTVAFLVDHIGYSKTLGYFSDVEGSFQFDEASNTVTDVNIVVKTASVQSDHKARDKHVKNKDFLNVKKYPTMVFTSSGGQLDSNNSIALNGQLSLLGQEQTLTLQATLNKSEKYPFGHKRLTLGVSARGSIMRSAYGMNYGVANGLVGDKVDLIIEIEAIKDK